MDYQKLYSQKKVYPQDIAGYIQDGWVCCTDIAASIPPAIMEAIYERSCSGSMQHVTLHTMLDLRPFGLFKHPEEVKGIVPVSWFSGGGLRRSINSGLADIMPCYYRDMSPLFRHYIDIDAVFLAVSPMDRHGYFSTGVVGSNSEEMIRKAKHIYLEVNEKMPTAVNAPQVHITQVTALCEHTEPLPVLPETQIDETSRTIGEQIAAEIPDGATVQLGIGAIPEAVGFALKEKKDLGLHTELFTDSMVELLSCGAVTNEKKPIYRGKTVATLAFGSERIYDYIDQNPSFMLLPSEVVNNPNVIAQHPFFMSVNAALEVDFFGQVCAESVGQTHVSGTGGQVDYVRGAVMSEGGKSFIAFPSTAKNGTISRIRSTLSEGAIVTTGKNDVDCIVTEYGIAQLRGKTLGQRTKALIRIAHPTFREELTWQAKKRGILMDGV